MDDPGEWFDVVDQEDRVVGQATRGEVHQRGLLHRSVHILVFNPNQEIFLQKRSLEKDENPGYWDTSAAGHVNAGEDYRSCAHRELEEELGITGELHFFLKIRACPETFGEHVQVYTCMNRQPIVINPQEISQGRYWSREEIQRALSDGSEKFTSTFKLIFDHYLAGNA